MTERFCDLHVHSTYSDGTLTPRELVTEAERIGLSAIAVTDHNTVDGIDAVRAAGAGSPVEVIPGIEISTTYRGEELHIVGLYLNDTAVRELSRLTEKQRALKEASNRRLAEGLRARGFDIDYEQLKKSSDGWVNRSHFADALVRDGYYKSTDEAFADVLSPEAGLYVQAPLPEAVTVVRLLTEIDAVPVWAHPLHQRAAETVESYLPELVGAGLRAMEVRYSEYDALTTETAERMAERFGLLPSGGSDFHGSRKPGIALGSGRGTLHVPAAWPEALKACRREI